MSHAGSKVDVVVAVAVFNLHWSFRLAKFYGNFSGSKSLQKPRNVDPPEEVLGTGTKETPPLARLI